MVLKVGVSESDTFNFIPLFFKYKLFFNKKHIKTNYIVMFVNIKFYLVIK